MRSVNLQLGLNSFWQEREGGEGRLRAAGQDPGSPPGPLGRGAPGAAPPAGGRKAVPLPGAEGPVPSASRWSAAAE